MNRPISRAVAAAAVALGVLGSASSAEAAGEANGFAQKGSFIISADRLFHLFSYTNVSVDLTQNGQTSTQSESGTSIALLWGNEPGPNLVSDPHTVPRVAFDFAVIDHLTIGGSVVVAFGLGGKSETKTGNNTQSTDAPTQTVFGIAPRVGYAIPVGDILAIWPRGGFAFYSLSSKTKTTQGNTTSTTTNSGTQLALDLDPMLVIAPIPNLFFEIGPMVNIPLTGSLSRKSETGGTTQETSNDLSIFHLGISAGLGGWFNL